MHDGERLGAVREIVDERAVDLDLVEGKAAQVAERRVARAEIVHRDLHAHLRELVQRGKGRKRVLQQDAIR